MFWGPSFKNDMLTLGKGSKVEKIIVFFLGLSFREGFKKSKWKFKMAFAMKGGEGLEGVSSAIYLF